MEYKVVPIYPAMTAKDHPDSVAKTFESLLKKYHDEGWQYERTESLKIWTEGDNGCFGLNAKPGFYSEKQMVVFKK